jgi:predicted Zn-dependent protease
VIKRLKTVFLLIILSVISTPLGQELGNTFVSEASVGHQTILTLNQEKAWGERIMREIRAQNQISLDEVLNAYLQGLAERVAKAAPKSAFPLKVFAIPSSELNAFTFFGGHIGVYYGLILGVASESELLAVLAHEYAHITQRHLARTLENHRRMMPLTMAEILGAIVMGSITSPEAGMYATQAILEMHFQKMMTFSRVHEQEADREAIHTLGRLKSDPRALLRMFERFNKGSYFHDKVPEYLRSHPLNESRIADAENRIVKLGHQADAAPMDSEFDWMLARALVASVVGSKKEVILQLKAQLQQSEQGSPMWRQAQYAMALCLQAEREYAAAAEILLSLYKVYPDAWVLALSLAEVRYLQGSTQESLEQFAKLSARYPGFFPIDALYSAYLIRDKKPALAKKRLNRYIEKQGDSLSLQQLLTQANRLLGDISGVHRAQAEWHLLRGDTKAAKLQVELALQHTDDTDVIALAKIDALKDRIRECEKM